MQRSSGYGQFARVGAFRKVTASVAFGDIVRIRDRVSEQRERIGGDATFGCAPVGARTNGRTADGAWAIQQTDRPPIEYRSRDRQVACETHLLEADGPDPGPSGLSSINARPHLSVATDQIVARPAMGLLPLMFQRISHSRVSAEFANARRCFAIRWT